MAGMRRKPITLLLSRLHIRLVRTVSRLKGWLEQRVLHSPIPVVHLFFALFIVPILVAAWLTTTWAMNVRIKDYLQRIDDRLGMTASMVREDLQSNLSVYDSLTDLLAQSREVQDALMVPSDNSKTHALDQFLAGLVSTLGPDLVWVADPTGTVVASSDYAASLSMLGLNVSDRDIFRAARLGAKRKVFMVGRTQRVPGLMLAAPVLRDGHLLGVVAVRVNQQKLRKMLHQSFAFVTDENQVIFASKDESLSYLALPGSMINFVPEEERKARYNMTQFPIMRFSQYESYGQQFWRIGMKTVPALLKIQPLREQGFHLYIYQPLDSLHDMERDRTILRWTVCSVGSILLWLFLASLVFVWRNKINERRLAIANLQLCDLNRELQRRANQDFLTGIANRLKFSEVLDDEIERANRYQDKLTVAILDIDHFKQVNDQFGHDAGDQALRHFANLVMKEIRTVDLFARIGGEEFGLILTDTDFRSSLPLLERVRSKVQKSSLTHQGKRISFTISIGVTEYRISETMNQLLKRADEALYQAKHQGRNRVCCLPESGTLNQNAR